MAKLGMKEKRKEKREERNGGRKSVWLVVISDGVLTHTVAKCSENKSSPHLLEKNVHIFNDAQSWTGYKLGKTMRKFGDMIIVTSASPPEVNYHTR